jgi:hypothetical protein
LIVIRTVRSSIAAREQRERVRKAREGSRLADDLIVQRRGGGIERHAPEHLPRRQRCKDGRVGFVKMLGIGQHVEIQIRPCRERAPEESEKLILKERWLAAGDAESGLFIRSPSHSEKSSPSRRSQDRPTAPGHLPHAD